MINILFRVLTISLLNTLVYSHLPFLRPLFKDTRFCFYLNGINVCFPKQDLNLFCKQGKALSEEQYLGCILFSTKCDASGKFPIPEVPSAYYTCKFNLYSGIFKKHVETCAKGKFFDPLALTCLNPEELSISRIIRTDEVKEHLPLCDKIGAFPNRHNCKTFYFCPSSDCSPLKIYCAPNLYYNENLKKCTSQMTRSCIWKSLLSEGFIRSRDKKYLASLKETLKLGLIGHQEPSQQLSDSENYNTELEDTQTEIEQYDGQPTWDGDEDEPPHITIVHDIPDVYFERHHLMHRILLRIKRLLTLPWRTLRSILRQACRLSNSRIFNNNGITQNFINNGNLGLAEDLKNPEANLRRRIFHWVHPFYNRFPNGQRKQLLYNPWYINVKEEIQGFHPEETEFGHSFNRKGVRKPFTALFDILADKQSETESHPLQDDLEDDTENHEGTEFGQYLKGKGQLKLIHTLLNHFPGEQGVTKCHPWLENHLEEQEYPEECGKYVNKNGQEGCIHNLPNPFSDEQREPESYPERDDLSEEQENLEESGKLFKQIGQILPLYNLFNRFPDEQKEPESYPEQDDLTEEQENLEEFEKPFKQIEQILPLHDLFNRFPDEKKEAESYPERDDLTKEQENPEESEKPFKVKTHKVSVHDLFNPFPDEQREPESNPEQDDLTKEQENSEEAELGKILKGKTNRISAHDLFNLLPNELLETEFYPKQDNLVEEQENPEESEKPSKGKRNRILLPDKQKELDSYPEQDDLMEEEEDNFEDIEFENPFKGKGPTKSNQNMADNRFVDKERERELHPEPDDVMEEDEKEDENTDETEFGNDFKGKGPGNTIPDLGDEEGETNEPVDSLTEEENPDETSLYSAN